jgi:hypothetical protein
LKGTGEETGSKYIDNEVDNVHATISGHTGVFNSVFRTVVVASGKTPNFLLLLSVHHTVHANGRVELDRFRFSEKCVGK